MNQKFEDKFTKYEVARILGARSLQLAMDAPILLKLSKEELDELNYNTLKIAEKELESEVLPITVKRPLPKRSSKMIKKLSEEEIKEKLEEESKTEIKEEAEDKEINEIEGREEKEIKEEGEIMEIATPEDETGHDDEESEEDELM